MCFKSAPWKAYSESPRMGIFISAKSDDHRITPCFDDRADTPELDPANEIEIDFVISSCTVLMATTKGWVSIIHLGAYEYLNCRFEKQPLAIDYLTYLGCLPAFTCLLDRWSKKNPATPSRIQRQVLALPRFVGRIVVRVDSAANRG